MPFKNLKPLIGIQRDEPLDFRSLTDNQRERIELAGACWYAASGALALCFATFAEPQIETPPERKTETCYVRGPFGVGGWAPCR